MTVRQRGGALSSGRRLRSEGSWPGSSNPYSFEPTRPRPVLLPGAACPVRTRCVTSSSGPKTAGRPCCGSSARGRVTGAGGDSGRRDRCPGTACRVPASHFAEGFPMQQPVSLREPESDLSAPEERPIRIHGAREHNLKNIDLELPRNAFIVVTGLSGSGKSSLAFDTLYAEGQRRYVESLSAYARQFLGQMEKPDVDRIEGLSPAISIEQRTTSHNPRSTVGTTTEIYDYLRLLFARVGTPHCYKCGAEIRQQSTNQMVEQVQRLPERTRILVLAPLVRGRKGEHRKIFEDLAKQGFVRMRVDGEIVSVEEDIKLTKNKKHTIEVVVDRLQVDAKSSRRLADSLETAVRLGNGLAMVDAGAAGNLVFSQLYACPQCGTSFEELAPRMFSFNSPYGACPACNGLGKAREISVELLIPDPTKSILEGAIEGQGPNRNTWSGMLLKGVAEEFDIDLDRPWNKLPKKHRDILLHGSERRVAVRYKSQHGHGEFQARFEGIISRLMRRNQETTSTEVRERIESYMRFENCTACNGKRLRPESLGARRRAGHRAGVRALDPGRQPILHDAPAGRCQGDDRGHDSEGGAVAAAILGGRRSQLPDAVALGGELVRGRGAAHPPGDADRVAARRRALHPRRAEHRAAPPRQPQAHRHAARAAAERQHGDRGGARHGHDPRGGSRRRPRARRRRARRVRRGDRHAAGDHGGAGELDRAVPVRGAHHPGARSGAGRQRPGAAA